MAVKNKNVNKRDTFKSKGTSKLSYMFAGYKCNTDKKSQEIPGPASYSISEPFKYLTGAKSHLNSSYSAFLSSSQRIRPLSRSSTPGPATYFLPVSTLKAKGGIVSAALDRACVSPTPGPLDYKIHPRYAGSAVVQSHNVTLGQNSLLSKHRKPRNWPEKRLRCFSEKRYETNHCQNASSLW